MALFPRFGLVPTSPIPWVDSGIAQGRVLSPLLFNLLVNSLAATISRASPGVRLSSCSDFRLSNQLYAVDLVILRNPRLSLAKCTSKATFCLSSLPIATSEWSSLPHFSWCNHVDHLVRSVSWVRSEGLPVSFSLFLLSTYVLPSASFGVEFAGECLRSLARFDRALRQWGRHLLGLAKWHTQCVGALRAWSSRWPAHLLWSGFGSLCSSRFLHARLPSSCPSLSLHSRPIHPWQLGTLCHAVISHHSVQRP